MSLPPTLAFPLRPGDRWLRPHIAAFGRQERKLVPTHKPSSSGELPKPTLKDGGGAGVSLVWIHQLGCTVRSEATVWGLVATEHWVSTKHYGHRIGKPSEKCWFAWAMLPSSVALNQSWWFKGPNMDIIKIIDPGTSCRLLLFAKRKREKRRRIWQTHSPTARVTLAHWYHILSASSLSNHNNLGLN